MLVKVLEGCWTGCPEEPLQEGMRKGDGRGGYQVSHCHHGPEGGHTQAMTLFWNKVILDFILDFISDGWLLRQPKTGSVHFLGS